MSSQAIHKNLISLPQELLIEVSNWLPEKDVLEGLMKTCRLFKQTFPDGTSLKHLVYFQRLNIPPRLSWGISPHDFRSEMMQRRDALVPHLGIFVQRRCIHLVRIAITSQKMTEEIRGAVARSAVINKNLSALQIILANGTISKKDRSSLVEVAVMCNQLSMIPLIIQSGEISDESREKALRAGASEGDLSLIKTLLLSGTVTVAYRMLSIDEAIGRGDFSCFQTLFEWGPLTDENRGKLLSMCVYNPDRLAFLRFILASGTISNEAISDAIYDAALVGDLEYIQELLKGCTVTPKNFHGSIVIARERGRADVVAYLEAWKPEEKKSSS